MLRLNISREPEWLELVRGVRVKVLPLTTIIYESARAKMTRMVHEMLAQHADAQSLGAVLSGLPDLTDEDNLTGLSQLIFVQALAKAAIVAWDGVGDAGGEVMPVSPEAVDDLMLIHDIAETFIVQYVRPFDDMVSEGNASGPVPNGTSVTGRHTDKDASTKDTVAPVIEPTTTANPVPTP